ncbi:UDP-glcnac-adolichol phosphate glcnac-1-p-transferase [Zea mays]|uniref:UDP-N-acetylglucosamine--dolichyl-phosphate N-acetylglucosaminephosphotransferase n=2 Tax=Zea mays TaxID=4577 RepID=A0A1D6F3R5_MAIZE|nr:UDP-glcnac-adolichol phosphate glcnac-1-p-transferase [Zea mays]
MAVRRRPAAAAAGDLPPQAPPADAAPTPAPDELVLRPPNLRVAAVAAVLFLAPFSYLSFVRYRLGADLQRSILKCGAMSLIGFCVALKLIPVAASYHLRRRMFGYDINKKGLPTGQIKVPEALGLVVGIIYLVIAIIFQQFHYAPDSIWLVEYNAAKLALPTFAALPLLMAYAGGTSIIIPKPLTPYVGLTVLELGTCLFYKLFMLLLAVFCTNSINIHAGLNGLEVGQTIVISAAVLIHNVMRIASSTDIETQQAHEFSIYLVLPFLTISLALLAFNWYPSIVFVGDTYTYFAGMALAVIGILGHFSETLLLFFLPQVLNFLCSVPQLFHFVPCPRHRLPRFDPETGLLTGTKDGNLVNIFLRLFGKCSEKALCIRLLIFQVDLCTLAADYYFTSLQICFLTISVEHGICRGAIGRLKEQKVEREE